MKITKGEPILLLGPKMYLMNCKGNFECKFGKTNLDTLSGKNFGTILKIGKANFTVVKPTFPDFLFRRASRGPQIILPRDASLIAGYTGAGKGWKVVDAGAGSAFLSMFLANIGCDVTTYEIRKDFYELARKNIEQSGLKIKVVNSDITKGIKEKYVDLITLDMQNPERAIKSAEKSLKAGGWLVVYSMTAEEVTEVVKEIKKYNFNSPRMVQNLPVEWQVEIFGKKTFSRPRTHQLSHTGFLIFARKM